MKEELILEYFDDISDLQLQKIKKLYDLYKEWNSKINVISRKDIENIYLHHVLHSLSILKFYNFNPDSKILDLGTGGGFPGIPLAIFLDDCRFTLIDGTAKKIKVVNEVVNALDLKNVRALQKRAEEYKEKFDFVVSRAVASIDKLKLWSYPLLKTKNTGPMPSGIFAYKGGNVSEEIKLLNKHDYFELNNIYDKIRDEYFKEKYIIYLQR